MFSFFKMTIVFLVVIVIYGFSSSITHITPGEVAVKVNNVTASTTIKKTDGAWLHLPFGFEDVYKINSKERIFEMSKKANNSQLKVKTKDGSNIEIDLTIKYRIIPEKADVIIRLLGREYRNIYEDKLVRPVSRSFLRDEFGYLSIEEISNPIERKGKIDKAQKAINDVLEDYGLTILQISAFNYVFNEQYEKMIKDRKQADQEFTNQTSAQKTAEEEQKREEAQAERKKLVAIEKTKGEQTKRIIEKKGWANQLIERSNGKAKRLTIEGEQEYAVALENAKAIEKELIAKAEGIRKMSEAYKVGGLSLVKEAIAKKLKGKFLKGRPYSEAGTISRLKFEGGKSLTTK